MAESDNTKEEAAAAAAKNAFRLQRSSGRRIALQYLYSCDVKQEWDVSPEALADFRELSNCEEPLPVSADARRNVWRYARELITQTVVHLPEIDAAISAAAENWVMSRMDCIDRTLLRLAVYEMRYEEHLTPAIAINEAIELAKVFGKADSARFINGVLDQIRRQTT